MLQEPLTIYKLMILYMLDKVSFPLTKSQITEFFLNKEYTNYLTLQLVFSELEEKQLITAESYRNKTLLSMTDEGMNTLHLLESDVNTAVRKDIKDFLSENALGMRNEVSVLADYRKIKGGEYEAFLLAKDRDSDLISLKLYVPTEEMADTICRNWQERHMEVYRYLTEKLF